MDSLLECLVILSELNHRPFSAEALSAGLPLKNNKLTPSLFIRAAATCLLSLSFFEIFQRPLDSIHELSLPAVLILKNNEACVLKKISGCCRSDYPYILDKHNRKTKPVSMPLAELSNLYLGFVILIKPYLLI